MTDEILLAIGLCFLVTIPLCILVFSWGFAKGFERATMTLPPVKPICAQCIRDIDDCECGKDGESLGRLMTLNKQIE